MHGVSILTVVRIDAMLERALRLPHAHVLRLSWCLTCILDHLLDSLAGY